MAKRHYANKAFCLIFIAFLLLSFGAIFDFHFVPQTYAAASSSYFALAADGHVGNWTVTYAGSVNASAGTVSNSSASLSVGQAWTSPFYYVYRAFLFFDTSDLPDDIIPSSIVLSINITADNSQTDFNLTVLKPKVTNDFLESSSPHQNLLTTDFDQLNYNTSVEVGRAAIVSPAVKQYLNITLNDWTLVNKQGITRLIVRSDRDIAQTAPTQKESVAISSNESGFAPQLYLSYNYTTVNTQALKVDGYAAVDTPLNWISVLNNTSFSSGGAGWVNVAFNSTYGRWIRFDNITTYVSTVKGYEVRYKNNDDSSYYFFSHLDANSGNATGHSGSNMTDGNTATDWQDTSNVPWLVVDIGSHKNVSAVSWYCGNNGTDHGASSIKSCNVYVGASAWTAHGSNPYLNGSGYQTDYIYTSGDNISSDYYTFQDLSGWENRWISNITLRVHVKTSNSAGNLTTTFHWNSGSFSYTSQISSTSWTTLTIDSNDVYWNMSRVNEMKVSFTTVGNYDFYIDFVEAKTYGWTLISTVTWYLDPENTRINWTKDGTSLYYGLLFNKTTTTQLQNYIDSLPNASDWHSWNDVLAWYARVRKLGIENRTTIEYALGNASQAGPLPKSGLENYKNYFYVTDRDVLYGALYYSNKYNYTTSKWNMTAIHEFFKNALSTNSSNGVSALQVFENGKIEVQSDRFYDENAECASVYLILYELGETDALKDAEFCWTYVNNNHWDETNQRYDYRPDWKGFECEAPYFLKVFNILYYWDSSIGNLSRINVDQNTRFLNQTWQSPQWTFNNNSNLVYSCIHKFEENPERRLENTVASWLTLLGTYDTLNSTEQQNFKDMLTGTNAYDPAWMLIHHNNTLLYNETLGQFRMAFDPETIGNPAYSSQATLYGLSLMFMQGISPVNTTFALPLEELHYEYAYDVDPAMLNMSLPDRTITTSVSKPGTLRFAYGDAPVNYTFNSSGVWRLTFNESWTGITGATMLSELPGDRKYLTMIGANSIGVDGDHLVSGNNTFRANIVTRDTSATLDTATFYWNVTGTMTSNGTVPLSDKEAWSNFTRTVPNVDNHTYVIVWYVTANDTNSNLGRTMHQYVTMKFGTIYIKADGSVIPSSAPIQRNGDLYTLSDNVTTDDDGIIIERGNMTLEGAGYTVQGAGRALGIDLTRGINVTITGIKIREFGNGVYLEDSSNNTISGNIVTQNSAYGIYFSNSSYNSISDNEIAANIGSNIWITNSSQNLINGNIITEGAYGIYFCNSSENNVSGNEIAANSGGGVWLTSSPNNFLFRNNVSEGNYGVVVNSSLNNTVYWNSFVNNTIQAQAEDSSNTWDNGYLFGGNYWSNYGGLDVFSGPYQNVTGSDGIGDTPYPINASNSDMYPLINPWTPPDAAATNITTVKLIVGRGYTLRINYTAANLGNKAEGFNISLYSDSIVIASNSTILIMGNSIKFSIRWNTTDFSYGNYTLSEYVEPLPSEVELSNNNFTGSTIRVTIPGDVDGDFRVKPQDLNTLLVSFGGKADGSGQRPYNPNCDIDYNGYIGPIDLNILLVHYGQHYP